MIQNLKDLERLRTQYFTGFIEQNDPVLAIIVTRRIINSQCYENQKQNSEEKASDKNPKILHHKLF